MSSHDINHTTRQMPAPEGAGMRSAGDTLLTLLCAGGSSPVDAVKAWSCVCECWEHAPILVILLRIVGLG